MMKQNEELKDCTFKPIQPPQGGTFSQQQTPMNRSGRREDPFLYERLSKSSKKINPELL
jgi:hypothetical protein